MTLNEEELAKQQEELKKLEQELEESKEEEGELAPSNENASQNGEAGASGAAQNTNDPDERSIFVKNVDYGADEASLTEHFVICGEIVRVHIRKDHRTQQPLGQAYIEFANKESSLKAKHLNESLFRGRQLTVEPKRKNIRGMGRGSSYRGRGGNPRALFAQIMGIFNRGMGFRGRFRGGGFRGRGRGGAGGPPA